jgi:hypothetical protein
MSDSGPGRASLGVEMWKSSQDWSVQPSAVRSIAWLGLIGFMPKVQLVPVPKRDALVFSMFETV